MLWVATALDDAALRPKVHQGSSFTYLDAGTVSNLDGLCTRLEPAVDGFARALRESSTNPYR